VLFLNRLPPLASFIAFRMTGSSKSRCKSRVGCAEAFLKCNAELDAEPSYRKITEEARHERARDRSRRASSSISSCFQLLDARVEQVNASARNVHATRPVRTTSLCVAGLRVPHRDRGRATREERSEQASTDDQSTMGRHAFAGGASVSGTSIRW
jgi:hypothetical protein